MPVPKIVSNARPDPTELLRLAAKVAAEGAALARRTRVEAITEVSTKSTDTDVVTAGDHAVDRQIVAALSAARPGDPILTEESGATAGDGAVRWILDPIDGTVNYLYGIPYYGVSLAAEVDGVVVAAVVHNAATDEAYTAVRGQGAFAGGRRLRGTAVTSLAQALVATGFGYDAARRAHQGRVVGELLPRVRDIRRFGAGAFDLCLAAAGRVDAFYEKGLNAWDYSAGALIATEAGLRVTGIGPDDPPGDAFVLAAPPAIHAELRAVLEELDAAGGA